MLPTFVFICKSDTFPAVSLDGYMGFKQESELSVATETWVKYHRLARKVAGGNLRSQETKHFSGPGGYNVCVIALAQCAT